jgi:hypothetical protein
MKSCPKCNRTFPDEGQKFCTFDGGLLIAPPPFDPNATMRATSADLTAMSEKPTSRDLPDPNATIADSSFASTVALPRNTAPTGPPPNTGGFGQNAPATPPASPPPAPSQDQTIALTSPPATPPPSAPPSNVTTSAPLPATPAPVPEQPLAAAAAPAGEAKKKSKLPLIIGGVLLFLFLGGAALVAAFFLVVKPRLAGMQGQQNENRPIVETNINTNANTQPTPIETPTPQVDNYVPPLGSTAFENSNERLDGKLAEHYFDFNFYYPESWQKDPKAGVPGATSFVKVERRLPPDFTQENFTVGWYTSSGTFDGDLPNYPRRVEELSDSLSKNIPEYRKVSEGPTMVNSMRAYEFRWVGFSKGTEQGDLKIWGRVIFLPTGKEGDTTGATLSMLSTSLAPELSSVDDLGVKGEAPVILESFRFGKKK